MKNKHGKRFFAYVRPFYHSSYITVVIHLFSTHFLGPYYFIIYVTETLNMKESKIWLRSLVCGVTMFILLVSVNREISLYGPFKEPGKLNVNIENYY